MNLPAMILAAGRGERMRPLTDSTPKPLLMVRGRTLIDWQLQALARDGVREVVINTAWLGEQFPAVLGQGGRHGLRIRYSDEVRDHGGALETAGGIATALPLLGACFWVLAGDVYAPDFRFDGETAERFVHSGDLAHLFLVPNPVQHPQGDFALDADGRAHVGAGAEVRWTYSTIGLYRAELFAALAPGSKAPLRPLLEQAMTAGRVGAQVYTGAWHDVGTPRRLQALNQGLSTRHKPNALP